MKKNIISVIAATAAVTALIGGCSMTGEPEATVQPIEQPAPTLYVYGEYALLDGYTLYQSPDGAFSIQLPEGSAVNDADPDNIAISIAGTFANPDTISITKSADVKAIDTANGLMDLLKDDNSIDITAFYVLDKGGAYEGYKYTYTSVDDPQLKGIKSIYFSDDGTAYTVNATIYNGGDETNIHTINGIVDTFINNL